MLLILNVPGCVPPPPVGYGDVDVIYSGPYIVDGGSYWYYNGGFYLYDGGHYRYHHSVPYDRRGHYDGLYREYHQQHYRGSSPQHNEHRRK